MDWDELSKELKRLNWFILLILGSASFFFMRSDFTLGLLLGGLIIIGNFSVLQRTIRRSFAPDGHMQHNKMALVAKYYFRLAIMGLIIYILITTEYVNPVGLAVGLSVVVISIVYYGIRSAWKTISGEAL